MFLLNNQPLAIDRAFTDANGTQYPQNWLRLSTAEEKSAIGITEVADAVRSDDRFYWNGDSTLPKALEDRLEVNQDNTPLYVQAYNPTTERMEDTTEQVVTKGLKSNFIAQVKRTAGSILAQTDWMVIRKAERDVAIPTATVVYRASVVAKAEELEASITAVTTVEQLAGLNLSFPRDNI
jgi:hypothetical protein